MLRQRPQKPKNTSTHSGANATLGTMEADDPRQPLMGSAKPGASSPSEPHLSSVDVAHPPDSKEEMRDLQNMSRKSQWIVLAVASGCCAAFNGVFAKLTTTELTTTFATSIANLVGLGKVEKGVEVVVRVMFFALNLIFNGVMWALFTKALARGTSTTQVSIINTSSNFMITAILGFMIFSESLPPLWWLGAALLVAGNVIIGRREETEVKGSEEDDRAGLHSEYEEILVELDEAAEERKRRQEEDDILLLGSDDENVKSDEELISARR